MPNKDFLENYPLYKECNAEETRSIDPRSLIATPVGYSSHNAALYLINKPAINDNCPICKRRQTYNMINDYGDKENDPAGNIFHVNYICMGCQKHEKNFFIYFFDKKIKTKKQETKKTKLYMMKVGQFPSWSIKMDENILKILNETERKMYQNGLICESQSYGIGAYAYYRRIVESMIDKLLNKIFDLVEKENKDEYKEALKEIEKSKNTSDKIKLVKNMLPQSLKLNGMNPLGALYKALSVGIHNEDDVVCLELAEDIRSILLFLSKKITEHENDRNKFTNSLKRLLEKKQTK